MYTQCPDCTTVFRVTAEALRFAQGDVRCGVCSTTFNALETLSEQAFKSAPEGDAPSPDDSMTVEELPGGENIELSAPVELVAVPDATGALPAAAMPDDEAWSMEFHGDAADLDSTDEHPVLVLDEGDEPRGEEVGETIVLETLPSVLEPKSEPVRPTRAPPTAIGVTAPRILIPDEMRRRLEEEATARAAEAREFEADLEKSPGFLDRRWPWPAGVALLALLLALQVVHAKRNDIVRSEAFGPALAGSYELLGLSVLAPTDLAAYELRQWGAASDPRESNRLVLRASIVNRASYSQPLPLLRLTLHDRFGGTLGQRDIGPADYLPGGGAARLLEPGQRADALIRIVDPGSEAVGYEFDICLPAGAGVRCANPLKTARQ